MAEEEPDLAQARLVGLARAFQNHIANWFAAVVVQERRIRTGLDQTAPSRWADVQFFAVALNNLMRACEQCASIHDEPPNTPFDDAVLAFKDAIPTYRAIRNHFEHFNEREMKDGMNVFVTNDGLQLTLHVNDLRLDLSTAVTEAQRLASSCSTALKAIGG